MESIGRLFLLSSVCFSSSPFAGSTKEETFEKILAGNVTWPSTFSKDAKCADIFTSLYPVYCQVLSNSFSNYSSFI